MLILFQYGQIIKNNLNIKLMRVEKVTLFQAKNRKDNVRKDCMLKSN